MPWRAEDCARRDPAGPVYDSADIAVAGYFLHDLGLAVILALSLAALGYFFPGSDVVRG
jgi:hypothetical protein